mmetsp:Transcript_15369/g.33215  ORF Transcript_15369/g.33215 Transcript_15369/m.33215 type:complete len:314 (+) Transcript_15369:1202-2143(+)
MSGLVKGNLSAYFIPASVSARYTRPLVPVPSTDTMRYSPTMSPSAGSPTFSELSCACRSSTHLRSLSTELAIESLVTVWLFDLWLRFFIGGGPGPNSGIGQAAASDSDSLSLGAEAGPSSTLSRTSAGCQPASSPHGAPLALSTQPSSASLKMRRLLRSAEEVLLGEPGVLPIGLLLWRAMLWWEAGGMSMWTRAASRLSRAGLAGGVLSTPWELAPTAMSTLPRFSSSRKMTMSVSSISSFIRSVPSSLAKLAIVLMALSFSSLRSSSRMAGRSALLRCSLEESRWRWRLLIRRRIRFRVTCGTFSSSASPL